MISLHYLHGNTAKIHENKRKLATKLHRSADFRSCLPPAQESAPGNDDDIPAKPKGASLLDRSKLYLPKIFGRFQKA